jgi:hypothetical protein
VLDEGEYKQYAHAFFVTSENGGGIADKVKETVVDNLT